MTPRQKKIIEDNFTAEEAVIIERFIPLDNAFRGKKPNPNSQRQRAKALGISQQALHEREKRKLKK